jgi:tRNA nucleotidyltransferase (CCA-adding enzyme)
MSAPRPIQAVLEAYPELARVREAATEPVYVVGGAVRDLFLDLPRGDLDLVVEGDAAALAARLGADTVSHERFGTARVPLDGHRVDIAAARSETYPEPGALPVVVSAADIGDDLARRDFTVNAMAIPLSDDGELIDPFGGRRDLAQRLLRVLHPGSFGDDPTRALRAARYAARLGFELEPETERLLRQADLETVSEDRREAELLRLAAEPTAAEGLELLGAWGLVELGEERVGLAARVAGLLSTSPWNGFAPRDRAVLAAARGPLGEARRLAAAVPRRPSEAVEMAQGTDPVRLAITRALGAEWLDRYLTEWSSISLDIDGEALIAAGVPEGPAIGRGLKEALRRKLDGEIGGAAQELEVALEAAGRTDGLA